ncbi:LysR family transcriptional regulator [Paracoccaceae bacterium GXU_MW_L88]
MDRLAEMRAFVAVVEQGGFTGAASALDVSKSAISKHIAALEKRLGVRMLNRTTRKVNPTEAGYLYFERARAILQATESADEAVLALSDEPVGSLILSAPVDYVEMVLSPHLGEFLERYPRINLTFELDNRVVDIVEGGFDAAIRIGDLPDSSLLSRRIGEMEVVLVASPDYLARAGTPETVADLADHQPIRHSPSGAAIWRFRRKDGTEAVHRLESPRLTLNNGASVMRAAVDGAGIASLPDFAVAKNIAAGKLVRVLPNEITGAYPIQIVWPAGRHILPKLRVFIDFMAQIGTGNDT